jgi:two-component system, NarL family, invasion response regulator UvrY
MTERMHEAIGMIDGVTSIMLVDDHAIVHEGYRSLLQKQPCLRIVAEATDGAEAYRQYKETRPDLVIMDLTMPGLGGIEAVRRIRQWDRTARILVFSMHQNAAYAVQAIRAGAKGYVTKSSPPEALVKAVFDVLKGRTSLSPDIDHELALSRLGDEPTAMDVLSPREFEILRMLLAGRTTQDARDCRDASHNLKDSIQYSLSYKKQTWRQFGYRTRTVLTSAETPRRSRYRRGGRR